MDAMRSGKLDLTTEAMDAIFAATDKLLSYIDLADHSQLTKSIEEVAGTEIDPSQEITVLKATMHGEQETSRKG